MKKLKSGKAETLKSNTERLFVKNLTSRELEMELLGRAIERTRKIIVDTDAVMGRLQRKLYGQSQELERQQHLAAAERGKA